MIYKIIYKRQVYIKFEKLFYKNWYKVIYKGKQEMKVCIYDYLLFKGIFLINIYKYL